ncbi:translocation/assembly module TamB domain-containing protein [Pseudomonas sp. TTU2014-080ASC]|uniref:translocation/assembly module TamB domain-containing protein n=1 Tax=Pseudomonas sp. TTU2014-080ASC TaxID=1729724 RepID=UPI0009E67B6D
MKRRFLIIMSCVLALLFTLLLAVMLLINSEAGSRWLLAQIPGLEVEAFEGRLGSQWSAERLHWQQGESSVLVESPEMQWSPACLLRSTLCIGRLHAGQITLDFPPSDEPPSDEPFSLPDLNLPLALELGDISLQGLRFNGSDQLQGAELVASWTPAGMQIETLKARSGNLALDVKGTLSPTGDWPLALQGQLTLPAPEQQPWNITLELKGHLQGEVTVQADSQGYLQGRLNGVAQPLAEHLPATLRVQVERFKANSELPDTLTLRGVDLQARGDLEAGYTLAGRSALADENQPVALVLAGLIKADGLRLDALSLNAGADQFVTLDGTLDWSQGLSIDSKMKWQAFPWTRLYPMETPPQVLLERLDAEVAYRDGDYLGNFVAALDGPAGAFTLKSPVSGNLERVYLPDLTLQAGEGIAQGPVSVGFADKLEWDVRLQVNQLDPGYWMAQMPGSFAGVIDSRGDLQQFKADVNLQGRLRAQPANLLVRYDGGLQQGELSALDVRLGDNRINGSAALQQRLRGQLQIDMPRLGQLWPGLQGQLNGQLDLAGTLQAPDSTLKLQGQRLGVDGQHIQQLTLDAALQQGERAQLALEAQGVRSGDSDIGRLEVNADGTLSQHQLTFNLQGPLLNSELALNGSMKNGNWRGSLSNGRIHSGEQDWRLQQSLSIDYLANGRMELGAHCWRSGPASLCGAKQRVLPDAKLDFQLRDLSMETLKPWLPEDFQWQGELNADLKLDLPASGPNGRIVVDAGRGVWKVREADSWVDFTYENLTLNAQLKPQQVEAKVELKGPEIGQMLLQFQMDPRSNSKPIRGSFDLKGLQLAMVRPFVPMVERVTGQLNGSGSISGTLLAPQVNGSLRVVDSEISGGDLPMDLQDLRLVAQLNGQQLRLDGGWRSGEQGQATLEGELNWASGLAAGVRLKGTELPVNVEPYAALEVEPDLQVRLQDDQLSVTGTVKIPKGAIEVRELPPSTVQVSADAQVIGAEQTQSAATAIAMDIDVEVGQERLTFKGFGLTADLAGRLHIGNDLDTRGDLSLNNGRFRAYGQRLNIRRARMFFTGPIDQPFLDIEAVRKVDTVTAGLRLTGNAAQPTTQVFSEPAMSQEQALSYLVLGRPIGQNAGDNSMLAQAALALGMAGSAPVLTTVAEGLGIKDFQLDTQGSGATTSVVASGNLSERLSLRYGVGVFEPANTIALRYELTRRLYLEAASGLASSLDLFYRRDF